ncbi:hypothetical protein DWB61_08185 [Ancylomarina euxinus]|uniref:Glycerophosphoryl diester phosphodiesterase membrane domain-containing protein n=1 Tax=Ancylomarina euxinus TaxID=2283627 RepID=A0A425Y2G0_9BACT|nr:hypothetical protein [Ancylomarina euxinus]MCZ4694966.1 hypothetical protein [Ancylomarina euxinus]MUP14831.1 hypothetical protein [Ancylomarina euxinus]RRG22174.1 hypothetical protein DWB61_08185 [Ancylomarina euxinus]
MNENYLNLHEKREFGDVISAIFLFLKQNLGRIFKILIIYVAPFALLYGISSSIGSYKILSSIGNGNALDPFANFNSAILLSYVFMFLSYTMVYGVILEYMKLYQAEGPQFNLSRVGTELMKDTRKILWTSFIVGLLTVVGFIFFLIPGIFLGVCFSLVLSIRIFENISLGDALGRSFKLIKNNWWWTFLILFIVGLIAGVLQMVFGIPVTIYQGISALHMTQNGGMELNQPLMILLYTIASLGTVMLQTLPIMGIAFQYFNLVEEKESANLLKELETIGGNE